MGLLPKKTLSPIYYSAQGHSQCAGNTGSIDVLHPTQISFLSHLQDSKPACGGRIEKWVGTLLSICSTRAKSKPYCTTDWQKLVEDTNSLPDAQHTSQLTEMHTHILTQSILHTQGSQFSVTLTL